MPEEFPKSLVMFMVMDLENKVVPVDVDVCLVGPNLTDEFKLSSNKGAQRSYSALQLNGDIEITITKAGYKTIKTKLKIEGRSAVAIRLDKEYTTQQISYKVGDYYNDGTKEGVVFWVDATGKHGKIVSMQESEMLEWAATATEKNYYIGASSRTNGRENMRIIKSRPNWRVNYPLAAWCANLGEGWYMPAMDELKIFAISGPVKDAINRTLEARGGKSIFFMCWSSTESNTREGNCYHAWYVNDAQGHHYTKSIVKFNTLPTRAIATF